MIKVVEQSTAERYVEMEQLCQQYLQLYHNTNMGVVEIRKKLGINPTGQTAKYIREQMKKEPVSSYERGELIRKGEWVK